MTGTFRNIFKSLLLTTALAVIAGCGGGGGSSDPNPVNRAPTISGSPPTTLVEGAAYSFQPTASDPDGDALTFSASGLPAWLAINSGSGLVSGTAPTGSAGSYSGIVISVSDGRLSASLGAFTLTVSKPAGNRPPTISGTPGTLVSPGQAYSFTPTASDPDGQTLAFGIANKPGWASFDTATGRLSGTPTTADVGTYSNIVISVSDGIASATLPAFSILVAGAADLSWVAPTQNDDGSPLTNLAGFKVRYGKTVDFLTEVLVVPGPSVTTARVEGLGSGTWYFTVAAYTDVGMESDQTAPVSKTIL